MRALRTPALLLTCLALFASACAQAPRAPSEWLPRAPGTQLRVLSWNVAREQFFAVPERTAQLLRIANPDVLLLDEMDPGVSPTDVAALMQVALPGPPWQVVLGREAGNRERGSILARQPLMRAEAFDALHYTDQEQQRWIDAAPQHAERLRRQLPRGVAAAGAVMELGGRSLLLVSFDMQCCGDSPEAWEEQRRRREAALIRQAVDATHARGVGRVILAGDANAVQGDVPLRALSTGTPALRSVEAAREDGSTWTWDGRGTPFPSSKLDYLWVSPGIEVLQARLLDTEGWSPDLRVEQGVEADWSRTQSPHRPIVADLRIIDTH